MSLGHICSAYSIDVLHVTEYKGSYLYKSLDRKKWRIKVGKGRNEGKEGEGRGREEGRELRRGGGRGAEERKGGTGKRGGGGETSVQGRRRRCL